MGRCLDYVQDLFGGPVVEQEADVATGAAAVVLVANDPDAVAQVFVNNGANDVYIGLRQDTLSANSGLKLPANGGTVSMNVTQDFTFCSRAWYAISPGGASSVHTLRISVNIGP